MSSASQALWRVIKQPPSVNAERVLTPVNVSTHARILTGKKNNCFECCFVEIYISIIVLYKYSYVQTTLDDVIEYGFISSDI